MDIKDLVLVAVEEEFKKRGMSLFTYPSQDRTFLQVRPTSEFPGKVRIYNDGIEITLMDSYSTRGGMIHEKWRGRKVVFNRANPADPEFDPHIAIQQAFIIVDHFIAIDKIGDPAEHRAIVRLPNWDEEGYEPEYDDYEPEYDDYDDCDHPDDDYDHHRDDGPEPDEEDEEPWDDEDEEPWDEEDEEDCD